MEIENVPVKPRDIFNSAPKFIFTENEMKKRFVRNTAQKNYFAHHKIDIYNDRCIKSLYNS